MKNSRRRLAFILAWIVLISFSCKQGQSPETNDQVRTTISEGSLTPADQPGTIKIAEQIIYDVEIINAYPDDPWTNEWLKDLDHKTAVDFVFAGIYQGNFKTFDIFEGTPISAKKIMKMEADGEFSRDQIGKFQFMEEWVLDTVNMSFTKKVVEIRMGLQKFTTDSVLSGYAPLLRVVL